jgi:hypothetical protein
MIISNIGASFNNRKAWQRSGERGLGIVLCFILLSAQMVFHGSGIDVEGSS